MKLAFLVGATSSNPNQERTVYPTLVHYSRNTKDNCIEMTAIVSKEGVRTLKTEEQIENEEDFFSSINVSDIVEENSFEYFSDYVNKGRLYDAFVPSLDKFFITIYNLKSNIPYEVPNPKYNNKLKELLVVDSVEDEELFNSLIPKAEGEEEQLLELYARVFANSVVKGYEEHNIL